MGGAGDQRVGLPYMLDVVGLNVELVNATFDAFQLDKQMDVEVCVCVCVCVCLCVDIHKYAYVHV